ncbi:nitroreductase/quinone reductase family protein [Kribbella sp. NPDC050459]|uniref:nitroreductase/quinone reductase family protein n=1 Tax=Kribbella sp. NPDC050459 TaxID=3155785 RepID=UPI0033D12E85
MSFDTRPGTRGARQPKGRMLRWINTLLARRIRRRGGKFMGFDALVLHTIGRKTGAERMTPVGWFPAADGSRLIVASAAGAPGNPAWYYNLAANPDQVRIDVGGQTVAVHAEQLHGAERTAAWERIVEAAPRFAEYQVKTDRELPVIRLVERR